MSKVKDLGQGWKVLEIKGRGVVVALEMGLVFVENAKIDEDGSLVADWPTIPAPSASPAKPGPSSIASVNGKAFIDEISTKNLTGDGHYGVIGPLLGRIHGVLKDVGPESPIGESLGNLLALGDHVRYGSAAAVVEMSAAKQDEFFKLLEAPDAEAIEAFVDRCISGAA